MPGLLSAADLSRARIDRLVAAARGYRDGYGRRWPGRVVGLMFYEASLRTRVGFEIAAARLGGHTTTILAPRRSAAMGSPETAEDAVRSIAGSCDVLCLRHPEAADLAGLTSTPVINCGDGAGEHPTQALVDVFAIAELCGGVDRLHVALVGDLELMRTAHSLALVLCRFEGVSVRCIGPAGLDLPGQYVAALADAGVRVTSSSEMDVDDVDIVYVAGLPAETSVGTLSVEQQAIFHVTPELVARMRPGARVLCPLPRVDEIARAVDDLPAAAYFEQAELGVWMRMAVLDEVFGG